MTDTHYTDGDRVWIYHADCRDYLATLPDACVDAVVTDPPYEIGFMGKAWDGSGVAYDVALWRDVLRVLKPGGHLLSFGGARTAHRIACAIEDAGFEVRDSIAWLYGSGFPKSLDVSKAIDKAAGAVREVVAVRTDGVGNTEASMHKTEGFAASRDKVFAVTGPATPDAVRWQGWGTALKPAFEPVVVARKPLVGTVAANVLAHGTGALNIDGCRVGDGERPDPNAVKGRRPRGMGETGERRGDPVPNGPVYTVDQGGRWPANVVLDPDAAAELDAQSGTLTSSKRQAHHDIGRTRGACYGAPSGEQYASTYGDTGGASRFFYVAKAPTKERPKVDGVAHPTVKPLALMRWLVRLVTPPGGVVLDPFAGSGTTVEAALLEGFKVAGVEMTPDYLPLIEARIVRARAELGLTDEGVA